MFSIDKTYLLLSLTAAQAERRALEAKQEFDQCSRLVKSEMARFEQERIEDFKNSLEAFLSGMISKQKEVSKPVLTCAPWLILVCS